MPDHPRHDEYESYQYLAPNDHTRFELPDVPDHDLFELSDSERQTLVEAKAASPVISLHDHPFYFPADPADSPAYFGQGRVWTAYDELAASNLTAVFDNLIDGFGAINAQKPWKWEDTLYDIGMRKSDIAHQDLLVPAESVRDIEQAHASDRIAWIPALEGGGMIENEIDRIDVLYGLGVRMMGFGFGANYLACGIQQSRDADFGLTALGEQAVDRMNALGVAIDVTHSSDQAALDICEASRDPVFLTHAPARALWDTKRAKPDDVISAVADTGGVIGVAAASPLVGSSRSEPGTFDVVMDHFEYVADLVGIDHVSFGPDLFYGDELGVLSRWYADDAGGVDNAFGEIESETPGHGYDSVDEFSEIQGTTNPTEAWHNIARWLARNDYSVSDIRKVLGDNTLRVLREAW